MNPKIGDETSAQAGHGSDQGAGDGASRQNYRYISQPRRTKEDGRFITGRGRFVQDIQLDGALHVALVASPHPHARILRIDSQEARAMDGVVAVLTGTELAAQTKELYHGVDIPNVHWYPLAVDKVRYVGEWVVAVVARDRYVAEDAAELIEVDYDPLTPVLDPEAAADGGAGTALVHDEHGSNIMLQKHFSWGPVAEEFSQAAHEISFRARWGRSSGVPIETFGVVCRWHEASEILDVWASIQMPQYQEQIADALGLPLNGVRVHNDIDVGGSYGTKRGIKQTVLAGYLARKLQTPVRLIEDRFDHLSGGGSHGPDRIFDVTMAYDDDGLVRAMKLRVLDDLGAYPGRAVQQVGKSITALCGPYRMAAIAYDVISVTTNKTSQVPMRGFGMSPNNFVLETGMDKIARQLGLGRRAVRQRNLIRSDEFPWRIPTGSAYDSGNYEGLLEKTLVVAGERSLRARRDELRAQGKLAGIGLATCLEPGGGNNIFEHLLNEKIEITTFIESVLLKIDGHGAVTVAISTTSSGQGHQTLVATIAGEELHQDPDGIRVVHTDSLASLPSRSPVASRMAIMLGNATARAARRLRRNMVLIAAHNLAVSETEIEYSDGVFAARNSNSRLTWKEIAFIAHRQLHRMPEGMEPGLQCLEVEAVPGGGQLPDADGAVPIYPCFSFQVHIPLVAIDPMSGQVELLDYVMGHDCGTMINPQIVRGMMLGGMAHGVGAALYEKFDYNAEGQLLSATLADYLLPSAMEIPTVHEVEQCTPSPLTSHGQKGSGEGGYLGAPAALASAVNDALQPLGITLDALPMRLTDIEAALNAARQQKE